MPLTISIEQASTLLGGLIHALAEIILVTSSDPKFDAHGIEQLW